MDIRITKDIDCEVYETEDAKVPTMEHFEAGRTLEVEQLSDEDDERVMLQLEDGGVVTLDKDAYVEI